MVQYVSVKCGKPRKAYGLKKKKDSFPTGKINHVGKLLTGPEDIKKLLEKEYSERLRPRPTHPNIENLNKIKQEAFELKLREAKLKKK